MYYYFIFYELLVFGTLRGKVNVKVEETSSLLNYLHHRGLQILKLQWILIGNSN
jgi:hypothetical protein